MKLLATSLFIFPAGLVFGPDTLNPKCGTGIFGVFDDDTVAALYDAAGAATVRAQVAKAIRLGACVPYLGTADAPDARDASMVVDTVEVRDGQLAKTGEEVLMPETIDDATEGVTRTRKRGSNLGDVLVAG